MSVPQNAILRVIVTLDLDSLSKAQNVFHLRHDTATAQADEDVLDAIGNWVDQLYDEISANLSQTVTIEKIEVYEEGTQEWNPVGVKTITWAGLNTQPRVPAGVAMMVMAYKARSGYADRKYLPGYCEDSLDGDGWSSGALANAANFADNWITKWEDANGVDLTAVYFNRSLWESKDYVSADRSTVVSYQRRRKPGVGLT